MKFSMYVPHLQKWEPVTNTQLEALQAAFPDLIEWIKSYPAVMDNFKFPSGAILKRVE